jgi:type I restriction enzyme M protein
MSNGGLGWITNFIWGIADDVLRDLYARGGPEGVIDEAKADEAAA